MATEKEEGQKEEGQEGTEGNENQDNNSANEGGNNSEGSEGNENQNQEQDDGIDYEGEVAKRGAKNVFLENKKKAEQLKEAKEALDKATRELEELKNKPSGNPDVSKGEEKPKDILKVAQSTEKGRKFIEVKKNYGYSDDEIRAELEMVGFMSDSVASEKMAPFTARTADSTLKDTLSEMANEDEYKFAIELFGNQVKDVFVKWKIDPKFYGDKMLIDNALGHLSLRNRDKLSAGKKREVIDAPLDKGSKGGEGSSGVSNKELEEYAYDNGLDISDPEVRTKIRKVISIKKKASERE